MNIKSLCVSKKLDKNTIYKACNRCQHYIVPSQSVNPYCEGCYGIICAIEWANEQEKRKALMTNIKPLAQVEYKIPTRCVERVKTNKPCEECGQERIPIKSKKDICGECLLRIGFRPCKQCVKVRHPEEVKHNICDKCFFHNMKNINNAEGNYSPILSNWITNKCKFIRSRAD